MAPNSDSTMRNSHRPARPSATRSESASTMWVCGEIGYAATTSGRHRATVSATAREPSICRSTVSSWHSRDRARLVAVRGELGVEIAGRRRRSAVESPVGVRRVSRSRSGPRVHRAMWCSGSGRPRRARARSEAGTVTTSAGQPVRPRSSGARVLLTSSSPSVPRPSTMPATCSIVGSCTTTTSGAAPGREHGWACRRPCRTPRRALRSARSRSWGSPVPCAPWSNAAVESSSAAVTTPCPPRPWNLTSTATSRGAASAVTTSRRPGPPDSARSRSWRWGVPREPGSARRG